MAKDGFLTMEDFPEFIKEFIELNYNQPERSKRENCERCNKLKEDLNDCCRIEISQMRCSEHCGNTVREVQ
jgi:hypothetical protein